MQKGMMVPFFTEIPIRKRLELMKKAGFDNLMFTIDRNHEKFMDTLENVLQMCKEIGIGISSAHAGYKEPDVVNFWFDNELGNQIEQGYLNDIKFAGENGIEVVVFHLNFETNYTLGQVGLNRLKNMVNQANKYKVKLAIENLYRREELDYIFEHMDDPYLGMCYDCGHENFLTPNENFLQKYPNKLFAVHLHDNDGVKDLHQKPFSNKIDWQMVAKGLAKANPVSLDGEIRIKRPEGKETITEEEYYLEMLACYQSIEKLEKMIENYKL